MAEEPQHEMTDREWVQWLAKRVKELEMVLHTLHGENLKLRESIKPHAQLSPLQIQTRDRVLQTMLDLLPAAERAARRGKPTLLRLISRTLHLKF